MEPGLASVFQRIDEWRRFRPTIDSSIELGFVPTMGALHAGHASLLDRARRECDLVALSIFVNPTQFDDPADLAAYPTNLDADIAVAESCGVDYVLLPDRTQVYPDDYRYHVNETEFSNELCGEHRPGHFDGVLTVVLKLLNLVQPTISIFGRKDAQQLASVKRMALDLNVDVEIVQAPIIREPDGLAMSSRNQYLSPPDRQSATALWRALEAASVRETATAAKRAATQILDQAAAANPNFVLDYAEVVDPDTFAVLDDEDSGPALLVAAATISSTRLIDNVDLTLADPPQVEEDEDKDGDRIGAARGVRS